MRNGEPARVAPRGQGDRECRDYHAGEHRERGPGSARGRIRTEARRAERGCPDHRGGAETDSAAGDPDEQRLGESEAREHGRRGTTGPQERLVAAAPIGARPRNRAGQQSGQQRPGQSEEEEGHAGVQAVAARGIECGREVVADDGRPRRARLEVPGEAERARVRGRGVAGQGATREVRVHLSPDERGVRACECPEERPPASRRHDQDVVGHRRLRGGGGGRGRQEQLLGRGEVDDAVDAHVCVGHACAADRHPIADADAEVRGHLLGDQDARVRADELAQLTGERRPVAVRHAEHESGGRSARRSARRCVVAGGTRVQHGLRRSARPGKARTARRSFGKRRARFGLNLPVERDARERAVGHRRRRAGQERADRCDQGDGDRNAGGRGDEACRGDAPRGPRAISASCGGHLEVRLEYTVDHRPALLEAGGDGQGRASSARRPRRSRRRHRAARRSRDRCWRGRAGSWARRRGSAAAR